MKKFIPALFLLLPAAPLPAQVLSNAAQHPNDFVIVSHNQQAVIAVDASDDALVLKAAALLQQDIEAVTGRKLSIVQNNTGAAPVIIIGSLQHSALVQQLVKEKKLQADSLQQQWEGYRVQVVNNRTLVITGSDRRGTAYGVLELSKQIGVSPWYWWADVPVQKKAALFFPAYTLLADAPKVKYRGIFINDEAPALSSWSKEKFGGFNHLFYEKVFELILRLKGNYIWPAMWGNAFYDDDSLNIRAAEQYGIVIGTTHHEPLMRAHVEWRRYGKGLWNYDSNATVLTDFWRKGMQRATNEKIVSVGMRGDGDMPMAQGTAISLLEKIVSDQRKIIAEVTGKPLSATPQLWALYKEVQDYYDKGMRVPDDITLLLCDDNWGNIRKLPRLTDAPRSGGYGIYYHFDYVGDPRNYKWINTNNIARVWEQMHLAYEYGVKNIWVVNVGDIKPMEFPISFFLDYAWNPHAWNEDNLSSYYTSWSAAQFGQQQGAAIGKLINTYSRYAARIKPELLDASTYSLTHYNEADRITKSWDQLQQQAETIGHQLPGSYKDAFFQLVLHPIKAYGNLQHLYTAVAKNKFYAAQQDTAANHWAAKAKQHYDIDSLITLEYHLLGNHKWNHMMDQTHIGYTYWQQPRVNKIPALAHVTEQGAHPTTTLVVKDRVANIPNSHISNLFYEKNGYISIEAAHWTSVYNHSSVQWKVIPDIGRSGSGISTFPVTVTVPFSNASPHVDYTFYTYSNGPCKLHLYFSPTLNFHNDEGLRFAVSVDQQPPVVVSLNKDDSDVRTWSKWVANNTIEKIVEQQLNNPGKHTLQYWMISPAVVLQKIVIDCGGMEQSYLGPPETKK
jgi:hypothetical protein